MNARQLAMRDPAAAALMGAIPGREFGFGDDYGFGAGFGLSAYDPSANIGDDYGDDYGFGAAPAPHRRPAIHLRPHHGAHHPAHAHHAAHAWAHSHKNPTSTASRTMLLDPNRDSTVKVERYSFSFSPTTNLTLGTASALGTFTQQPSTSIKPQRLITNAPIPGFVTITTLQIANVNVFVGTTEDAFTYNAGAQGVMLDLPRLDPQNRATAAGSYTGVLPAGFTNGTSFQFIMTLQGPATLAGGYGQ
jgi:hypothetical protein